MKNGNQVILGIIPGTRYLGVAVLHDGELRDWRIKTFKGKWSSLKKKKISAAIERMIDQYQVTTISLKKFHPSRSSKNLDNLIIEIEELAKSKKLIYSHYSIADIKERFCNKTETNKLTFVELLSKKNPELYSEFVGEHRNQNSYYQRMFEAVAISQVCSHRFKN